jgi:hypothetical protein
MLRRILLQGFLLLMVCGVSAEAQTATAAPQAQSAPQAPSRDPIDVKLQQALRERDAIIRNLLERVSELERRLNGVEVTPSKAEGKPTATPPTVSPAAAAAVSTTTAASVVANSTYDKAERQASEALDQALLVHGGLLLPSGTLEIDNTASYFSASSDHLTVDGFALLPVLVVGQITSQRVRANYVLPTFTTRLGLPGKFQMDFRIPYGFEQFESIDANNNETSSRSFGLGDMAASVSRQVTTEHGSIPDIVANVLFKSTTGKDSFNLQSSEVALGTGFNSWQGNLTFAKSDDPVEFFGNLFYTANVAANHTVSANDPNNPSATMVGHIKEGNAEGFQLGSILALNPETSMTMGWDQRFTHSTKLNGVGIPSSSLVEGTLRFGMSYLYAPGRTIDLNFGVGVTPDTPNLQFSIGLPFRLSLWGSKSNKLSTK